MRCFLLALAIVTACLAQTQDVATAMGTVADTISDLPIPGASVSTGPKGQFAVTVQVDASSRYSPKNVPAADVRNPSDSAIRSGPGSDGPRHDGIVTYALAQSSFRPRTVSCTFFLTPTSINFMNRAGTSGFSVSASDPSCAWTAVSNDSWITITSGASGTGTGTVSFSVAGDPAAAPRTGTITAAGQTLTIQETSGCAFVVNEFLANVSADAGTGALTFTASDPTCAWTISVPQGSFVTITSATSGSGSATVNYSYTANTGGLRGAIINLLNGANPSQPANFQVFQAAPTPTPPPGTPIPPSAILGITGLAGLGLYQLRRFRRSCQD